jgi:hydrogenase-4 component E
VSNHIDVLLLCVLSLSVYTAATSRLPARIGACALQGALLAGLAIIVGQGRGAWGVGLAASTIFLLKAVLIPVFLRRAIRRSGVRREVEPFVSLHGPLLAAAALAGLAFWLGGRMQLPAHMISSLGVRVGLATVLIGLFMTIRAHTELAQVIGYLVIENGVFVIGQVLIGHVPLVIELGVLLDVLVAGMLMAVLFVLARREDPTPGGDGMPSP